MVGAQTGEGPAIAHANEDDPGKEELGKDERLVDDLAGVAEDDPGIVELVADPMVFLSLTISDGLRPGDAVDSISVWLVN